ncbi:MAG: asparagine synthase (glutamine-hydrolyzing) [Candidatus Paceibacterota bacterium]|jgi:asparagine synthase (glutamine-hydrolysing)
MCGIAGIYKFNKGSVDRGMIKKMTDALAHRGPDDEGSYIKDHVGLGHRRLSIIDISPLGHQPMSDESGKIWIVFNGEIYNYIELRRELQRDGFSFRSDSDTEVIICAYKKWGEKCFEKFNGMWALAIWDETQKKVILCRDRLGIKPLYYFQNADSISFASEIKALLALGMKRQANDELIYDFLKFGMLDHTDGTFFLGINKVPPAHYAVITENNRLIFRRYWDFETSEKTEDKEKSKRSYANNFLEIFRDAIKIRLRSDVPAGSCLSGGLDSSSIVCVINDLLKISGVKQIKEKQKTFSSCSNDLRFDERIFINEVLKKTGAESHFVFPDPKEFLIDFEKFLLHQEEPVRGISMYAQFKVYERARKENVIVLLDGQGADEILGGYRKFYFFYLNLLLGRKKYLKFLKESFLLFSSSSVIKTLNLRSGLRYFSIGRKIMKIENLFEPAFQKKHADRNLQIGMNGGLGRRFKEDATKWSLPVLLRYADRNSMAHSTEARLPFLDYRLVEAVSAMPMDEKMRNGWTKYVMRNAMKGILPEKIRLRKDKMGFTTPEEVWLKSSLREEVEKTFLHSSFLPKYVLIDRLNNSWESFLGGKSIYSSDVFFRFFILERWAKIFKL